MWKNTDNPPSSRVTNAKWETTRDSLYAKGSMLINGRPARDDVSRKSPEYRAYAIAEAMNAIQENYHSKDDLFLVSGKGRLISEHALGCLGIDTHKPDPADPTKLVEQRSCARMKNLEKQLPKNQRWMCGHFHKLRKLGNDGIHADVQTPFLPKHKPLVVTAVYEIAKYLLKCAKWGSWLTEEKCDEARKKYDSWWGDNALLNAIKAGDHESTTLLVKVGKFDPFNADELPMISYGYSAFHYGAYYEDDQRFKKNFGEGRNLDIFQFLYSHVRHRGQDLLKLTTKEGDTALHVAAKRNNTKALRAILRLDTRHAICHVRNRAGETPEETAKRWQSRACRDLLATAIVGSRRTR